jgi:hypothetical protein
MAVEEVEQQTLLAKPVKFEGGVIEFDVNGKIRRVALSEPMTERFDRTFMWDVVIAVALFAVAVVCVVIRMPIIGHPWSLLFGPLVGLILTSRHRPAR